MYHGFGAAVVSGAGRAKAQRSALGVKAAGVSMRRALGLGFWGPGCSAILGSLGGACSRRGFPTFRLRL